MKRAGTTNAMLASPPMLTSVVRRAGIAMALLICGAACARLERRHHRGADHLAKTQPTGRLVTAATMNIP